MDKFVINGPAKLSGSVRCDGSKNAALPIIAATLLVDRGESVIRNVPPLRDIYTIIKMLEFVGAKVTYSASRKVMTVNARNLTQTTAPYELMRQMRASFLVLGPLLSRMGEAKISLPGGCSLGSRPVDYHIKAFAQLGAKVQMKSGYVVAKGNPLEGGKIYFDRPSHTGTENLMFGAVFAKNKTQIINAACDPEIVDVANYMNAAGAKIHGAGTPFMTIEPVKRLKAVEHRVSGDRLVAGTFLYGAAMTQGKVEVTGVDTKSLTLVTEKLAEMGCKIETTASKVKLMAPKKLKATNLVTFPYPGYPTDLQACAMAAATISSGTSSIRETVFTDRFSHAMELRRLGADIVTTGGEALVHGVDKLNGAEVMAPDIRAGAGIVLACLAAQGKSEILRVYHVDRGYDRIEEKLASLGADIVRAES